LPKLSLPESMRTRKVASLISRAYRSVRLRKEVPSKGVEIISSGEYPSY